MRSTHWNQHLWGRNEESSESFTLLDSVRLLEPIVRLSEFLHKYAIQSCLKQWVVNRITTTLYLVFAMTLYQGQNYNECWICIPGPYANLPWPGVRIGYTLSNNSPKASFWTFLRLSALVLSWCNITIITLQPSQDHPHISSVLPKWLDKTNMKTKMKSETMRK